MPLNKRKEKKSNHNTENIISESFFSIFVFWWQERGDYKFSPTLLYTHK